VTYNEGLGAEPLAGSRGSALGQRIRGPKPPEAEALLVCRHSMKAANLPIFLKFGNAKITYLCYLCKKITGGHETGETGGVAKLGACAPLVQA